VASRSLATIGTLQGHDVLLARGGAPEWALGAPLRPSNGVGHGSCERISTCGLPMHSGIGGPYAGTRPSSNRRKYAHLAGKGPGHRLVLIALGNISTPRNQQHKGAKEHKSNDSMKTGEPRNAMAKGEMDG